MREDLHDKRIRSTFLYTLWNSETDHKKEGHVEATVIAKGGWQIETKSAERYGYSKAEKQLKSGYSWSFSLIPK